MSDDGEDSNPPQKNRKGRFNMNATAKKHIIEITPRNVRKYKIRDTEYTVTATVKKGADEKAEAKVRRLIRNEMSRNAGN